MTIRTRSLAALALDGLLVAGAASAAPEEMTRDAIAKMGESIKGYSYWWGHGRWRSDGEQHGSCSGSCPSCSHSGSWVRSGTTATSTAAVG